MSYHNGIVWTCDDCYTYIKWKQAQKSHSMSNQDLCKDCLQTWLNTRAPNWFRETRDVGAGIKPRYIRTHARVKF